MTRKLYTPTYQSWQAMKQRCNNTKHACYQNYGGRGIKVCPRWETYSNFLADMGERPEGCSIDRIDNDLGYTLENCKWSTRTEQNRNNTQNRLINYQGKTKCLSAWCELLGLTYPRVYMRVFKLNWSTEDAFNLSSNVSHRR